MTNDHSVLFSKFLDYQWEDAVNEKYPHVVYEEHCKGTDPEKCEPASTEVSYPERLEGLYFLSCWSYMHFVSYANVDI